MAAAPGAVQLLEDEVAEQGLVDELYYAVEGCDRSEAEWYYSRNFAKVETLLKRGVDPNAKACMNEYGEGRYCLNRACQSPPFADAAFVRPFGKSLGSSGVYQQGVAAIPAHQEFQEERKADSCRHAGTGWLSLSVNKLIYALAFGRGVSFCATERDAAHDRNSRCAAAPVVRAHGCFRGFFDSSLSCP